MTDPITNILYAIGGAIFGGYITYRFRIGWYKRTKYIDACIKFKTVFANIIDWLKNDAFTDSVHTSGKLKELHERHKEAINNFRIFVPHKIKGKFDIACTRFYNKKEDDTHNYTGYSGFDKSPEKESRKEALNRIDELLKFAKC